MPTCRKVLPSPITYCLPHRASDMESQPVTGTSETLSSVLSEAIHAKCIVTEMMAGKDTTSMAVQCYLAGKQRQTWSLCLLCSKAFVSSLGTLWHKDPLNCDRRIC